VTGRVSSYAYVGNEFKQNL